MLSFSGSLRVFVAVEACDMRKGFEGLSALVGTVLNEEVKSGALFASATGTVHNSRSSIGMVMRHARLWDVFWAGKDFQGGERSKWSSAGSHNFAPNRFLELKSICRWGRRNVGKLLSDPWSLDSYEKGLFCSTHIWRSFATTKHRFCGGRRIDSGWFCRLFARSRLFRIHDRAVPTACDARGALAS